MNNYKFNYKWYLKNGYPATGIKKHNKKVFGTFICGGGSSMGYKLAGYNHLGGVEIDPKVADVYKTNHCPKYFYIEDLRIFNERTDLPNELYNLDLLDGSPPCSSFSMAGSREKTWGKMKKFREGQTKQILDDLVYVYIDTISKLKPKVALLENVKGLIQGNAKDYAKKIKNKFEKLGYRVQIFLLNAASMGVPQKRERVFFIGLRKDFKMPILKLNFKEKPIYFKEYLSKKGDFQKVTQRQKKLLDLHVNEKTLEQIEKKHFGKGSGFTDAIVSNNQIVPTLTANGKYFRKIDKSWFSKNDFILTGSYPLDYNFKAIKPQYLIGMSVPPLMTAQISNQIYLQWLSKL